MWSIISFELKRRIGEVGKSERHIVSTAAGAAGTVPMNAPTRTKASTRIVSLLASGPPCGRETSTGRGVCVSEGCCAVANETGRTRRMRPACSLKPGPGIRSRNRSVRSGSRRYRWQTGPSRGVHRSSGNSPRHPGCYASAKNS